MSSASGTVLGCIVLQTVDEPRLPAIDYPFVGLDKIETGNHITSYDSTKRSSFDFWHGGRDAENAKMFLPSRGLALTGFRVGEQTDDNLTRRCIQYLLALNSNPTEEERNKPFLDMAFSKIFSKVHERFFLSLDMTSSASKFVLMARDVPVYFTGFCDNESTYLLWTNESGIEERLRDHYKERFYYYRMRPFTNGTCVIQSMYLKKKVETWRNLLPDKLKFMNALEVHLFRRLMSEDNIVNDSASLTA